MTDIKENGMDKFLKDQERTWKCPNCGELVCCHNGICFNCGLEKLSHKKAKNRWNDEQDTILYGKNSNKEDFSR